MKKKLISLTCIIGMTASLLAGCAAAAPAATEPAAEPAAEEAAEEAAETEEGDEMGLVGMANPWVVITEEEAAASCDRLFTAPEGASDIEWRMLEGSEADSAVDRPLLQLSFTMGDPALNFTARAQQGIPEDTDIAGNFVEWTVEDEATLANWGEGNMPAKYCRSVNDSGMVDQISWYDVEIGILYTLSTSAADLEGFDLQAVAEAMYTADNEPYVGE